MRAGRVVRVLVDKDRKEIFNSNNEKRNLIMSIFYPVDDDWGERKWWKSKLRQHV